MPMLSILSDPHFYSTEMQMHSKQYVSEERAHYSNIADQIDDALLTSKCCCSILTDSSWMYEPIKSSDRGTIRSERSSLFTWEQEQKACGLLKVTGSGNKSQAAVIFRFKCTIDLHLQRSGATSQSALVHFESYTLKKKKRREAVRSQILMKAVRIWVCVCSVR